MATKVTKDARSVGDLVARACTEAALAFARADPLGAAPATSRNVHDARVALRRLRSHLRTFEQVFAKGWAEELRSDLKWYADELSHLRDLDVMTARIGSLPGKRVTFTERSAAYSVLTARRSSELQRLLDLRFDPEHRLAVVRLEAVVNGVPLPRRAGRDVATALPELLQRPYDELRETARRFAHTPSDRRVHQLRIRAKEVRYAAELAASAFGTPAQRAAKAAERMQTDIGDGRDALLAATFLARARQDGGKPKLDVGSVISALAREGRIDRSQVEQDLRRLRRRWRALRQATS